MAVFPVYSALHAVKLLQGKRRVQILCVLRLGPIRLGRLSRLLPSASKKVLTENLRTLEGSGIVVRHDLSGSVRHIEYDIAEAMRSRMYELLDQLESFGSFHSSQVDGEQSVSKDRKG